jgi:hypothetical protein
VVRNGFTRDLADFLVTDLENVFTYLERLESPLPSEPGEHFHH